MRDYATDEAYRGEATDKKGPGGIDPLIHLDHWAPRHATQCALNAVNRYHSSAATESRGWDDDWRQATPAIPLFVEQVRGMPQEVLAL